MSATPTNRASGFPVARAVNPESLLSYVAKRLATAGLVVNSGGAYFERSRMASITGLGGAFIRAEHPEDLYAWYELHLGLKRSKGALLFPASTQRAHLVVAFFRQQDEYFPLAQRAMLNFQVDDLDGVLDRLESEGVPVDAKRESYDFGKFGWFTDPEGNRVELWQPAEK